MRLVVRWQRRRAACQTDERLRRFRRVLLGALRTQRYRPQLKAAGLGTPEAIFGVSTCEPALRRLAPVELEDYWANRADFHNPGASPPDAQVLLYPLEPLPRVAILVPGFRETGIIRVFDWQELSRLRRFQAEVIAAPASVLRELARKGPPALTHAVIVFTGVSTAELTQTDRDLLWEAFQVPVFEQFLGPDGRVIAWECQAHNGLHLRSENAILEFPAGSRLSELYLTSLTDLCHPALRLATRFHAIVSEQPCECGRSERRLMTVRRMAVTEHTMTAPAGT